MLNSQVKYNKMTDRERKSWWKLVFANGCMIWGHFKWNCGVWAIVSLCPHYKSRQEAIRRFYVVERAGKILFSKMIKMFFKPRQEKIDNWLQYRSVGWVVLFALSSFAPSLLVILWPPSTNDLDYKNTLGFLPYSQSTSWNLFFFNHLQENKRTACDGLDKRILSSTRKSYSSIYFWKEDTVQGKLTVFSSEVYAEK